ncbi:hypothetical protein AYI70_g473 [Smittium culicis]|uniref:Uncharacterized protein n=1 Tax=Smittium culicis TaxID=133412 RepID=A0A1R1YGN3_9FUNG|nr:hypothetical protein AYI70_g473 [Smittium culicis]
MIVKAKSLKAVLSQTLTGDVILCALFSHDGVLLSEAHVPDFSLELDSAPEIGSLEALTPKLENRAIESSSQAGDVIGNIKSSPLTNYNSINDNGSPINLRSVDYSRTHGISPSKSIRDGSIEGFDENDLVISIGESIKSYLAVIATLWNRYERLNSFVGAYIDGEENSSGPQYENDLNTLTIESKHLFKSSYGVHNYLY